MATSAVCVSNISRFETGFQQFFLRGLNDNDLWPPIALYLTGAIFSAIHLVAWNWEFPSPLIQTLWRCFGTLALAMTLFPLSVALWGFIHEKPPGTSLVAFRVLFSYVDAVSMSFRG